MKKPKIPDVAISLFLLVCLILAFVDFGLPLAVRWGFVLGFVLCLCIIGFTALFLPNKKLGDEKNE